MKKDYSKTRCIALLCLFVFSFSLVLTGCSKARKITPKQSSSANGDQIQIGQGDFNSDGPTQIVVGEDGQSFIVDDEGHSQVYNPNQSGGAYTAAPVVSSQIPSSSNNKPSTNSNTKPSSAKKTTTATTQEPTSSPKDVYNALAVQRKFGFNKYYDWGSKFVNFFLSTIRVYFTYDEKDWLIELWKGEYAMATVGCEVGYYYRDHSQTALDTVGADNLPYDAVEDQDAMMTSMKLWQYEKSTDETPVQKIDYPTRNCWWAADFETGVLEKHRDQTTLVMTATIEFPTTKMLTLFTDELDKKGFKEGSINSYHNVERYSVSGKKVTICWRYFDED